jgi:hypothetical protein
MEMLLNGCAILNNLKFNIVYDELVTNLNINDNIEAQVLKELIEEARKIAKPKALFKKCVINRKGTDYVVIDNKKFFSKVVSVNLHKEIIVFPYIVTCGNELQEWCNSQKHSLASKIARSIGQSILVQMLNELPKYLENEFKISPLARVNPGSTIDWDLSDLEKIFSILDNPLKLINVSINDSFFMSPTMTNSGIYFRNETGYKNCIMCTMDCPLRETSYDKDYYSKNYENFNFHV